MSRRLRVSGPVLVVVALWVTTAPAMAHADVVDTEPAVDEVLDQSPSEVQMTFSEELDSASSFTVVDPSGDPFDDVAGSLDLNDLERVTLSAPAELAPGRYRVEWSAVSAEDGDTTSGWWGFSVADAAGQVPNDRAGKASGRSPLPVILGTVAVVAAMGVTMRRRGLVGSDR